MGSYQNDRDKVVINEVTVSFRALKNSPHDSFTYDENGGFRGVNLDGKHFFASQDTAIRSVNASFDGVSLECDVNACMLMKDPEHRASLVKRAKDEAARQEAEQKAIAAAANVMHVLEPQPDKEKDNPGYRVWRCQVCRKWTSVRADADGAGDFIAAVERGDGFGGCLGPPEDEDAGGAQQASVGQVMGEIAERLTEVAHDAAANAVIPDAEAVETPPVTITLPEKSTKRGRGKK